MVKCKITCPNCSSEHEVEFNILNSDSILECIICKHEFTLNKANNEPYRPSIPKNKRPKKTFRKSPEPSTSGKFKRISPVRHSTQKGNSKLIAILAVFSLTAILISVFAFKFLKLERNNNFWDSSQKNHKVDNATSEALKKELVEIKKQIIQSQNTSNLDEESSPENSIRSSSSALVSHKNIESLSIPKPEIQTSNAVEPSTPARLDEKIAFEEDNNVSKNNDTTPEDLTSNSATIDKNIILIESEQAELKELSGLQKHELTEEENVRLKELKNKFLWYKANRFKMSREELDIAWEKRWTDILASNSIVKGRSDSMLPRPLQILLEGAKNKKERIYLMRIYQKPVSFEEKEMVRKARNQAIWEKRKENGPQYYAEDSRKKRNEKYTDENGYEYYLNDKGQRIYL